jgi:hypothetical protein
MGLKGTMGELFFMNCTGCEYIVAQGLLYRVKVTSFTSGSAKVVITEGPGEGIPRA